MGNLEVYRIMKDRSVTGIDDESSEMKDVLGIVNALAGDANGTFVNDVIEVILVPKVFFEKPIGDGLDVYSEEHPHHYVVLLREKELGFIVKRLGGEFWLYRERDLKRFESCNIVYLNDGIPIIDSGAMLCTFELILWDGKKLIKLDYLRDGVLKLNYVICENGSAKITQLSVRDDEFMTQDTCVYRLGSIYFEVPELESSIPLMLKIDGKRIPFIVETETGQVVEAEDGWFVFGHLLVGENPQFCKAKIATGEKMVLAAFTPVDIKGGVEQATHGAICCLKVSLRKHEDSKGTVVLWDGVQTVIGGSHSYNQGTYLRVSGEKVVYVQNGEEKFPYLMQCDKDDLRFSKGPLLPCFEVENNGEGFKVKPTKLHLLDGVVTRGDRVLMEGVDVDLKDVLILFDDKMPISVEALKAGAEPDIKRGDTRETGLDFMILHYNDIYVLNIGNQNIGSKFVFDLRYGAKQGFKEDSKILSYSVIDCNFGTQQTIVKLAPYVCLAGSTLIRTTIMRGCNLGEIEKEALKRKATTFVLLAEGKQKFIPYALRCIIWQRIPELFKCSKGFLAPYNEEDAIVGTLRNDDVLAPVIGGSIFTVSYSKRFGWALHVPEIERPDTARDYKIVS